MVDETVAQLVVGVGQVAMAGAVAVIAVLQLRSQKLIADRQHEFQRFVTDRQLSLDAERLRLDLFDKRYEVYQALENALRQFSGYRGGPNTEPASEVHHELWRKEAAARFLFGEEVRQYLAEVNVKITELRALVERDAPDSDPEHQQWATQVNRLHKYFSDQVHGDVLPSRFDRYMSFEHVMGAGRGTAE